MFTTVAGTYDLVNKVLTFGLDQRWRKACARESASDQFVVDLCCGTGDLSVRLLPNLDSGSCLVGLDFNKEMLSKAVPKLQRNNVGKADYSFIIADAAYLPFKDSFISQVSISFSFRNLIYKNPKAVMYLKEVSRILKNNGKFSCIETSQPKNSLLRAFFHFYCLKIVPSIGGLICGRKGPYKYLGNSAANFPFPQEIMIMLNKAGFKKTTFKPLSFGIVGLYIASK